MKRTEQARNEYLSYVRKSPRHYVGNVDIAHLEAVLLPIRLIWLAQTFVRPAASVILITPTQFTISFETGPLDPIIDECLNDVMLDVSSKADILFGLKKATSRLTCAGLETHTWWRYFNSSLGLTLDPLAFDVYLTHFAAISIKTSKGHWTQVYKEGCPTGDARLLHLETNKSFSLFVVLNAPYFPYLPYTYDSVLNIIPDDIKPMTRVIWSPDDIALSDME